MNNLLKGLVSRTAWYGLFILAIIQALGPIIWMLIGSVKTSSEFYRDPWGLPATPQLSNYIEAMSQSGITSGLWNSVTVVLLGTIILAITAGTTAYALTRYRFSGEKLVFSLILLTMMVPPDVLIIPLFTVLRSIGLLGNLFGLAFLYAASGFGMATLLLRGYFISIPVELEEAARLDGANFWGVLRHVVIPLSLPGFASVLAIQAMSMWNDLYLAFVFVRDPALATAPVGLLSFFQRDSINWPFLLSALATLTLPVLIVFALLQKRFVEGMLKGGIK